MCYLFLTLINKHFLTKQRRIHLLFKMTEYATPLIKWPSLASEFKCVRFSSCWPVLLHIIDPDETRHSQRSTVEALDIKINLK